MLRRVLVLSALASALPLTAHAATRAAANAPALVTISATDRVTADERLVWNIAYVIRNAGPVGFYPDSFAADFVDEDAAATLGPRRWTESLNALLSALTPVSSNDSLQSSYFVPARFERGTVTLRLFGHTVSGPVAPLTTTVHTDPGVVSEAYPSELLPAGNRKVEVVAFAPRIPDGKAPGVLLVHGDTDHARRFLQLELSMRERGFGVVSVSLPGFGASTGPDDLNGPATSAALDLAYERLAKLPGIDPAQLIVWGTGHGATAAALLAGRRADLAALVVQSGTYDLWAAYRAADGKGRALIEAQAGRDSAGWRARSPLLVATAIKCPVLLIHGEKDTLAPSSAAHAWVAALQASGNTVDARFQADRGRDISLLYSRSAIQAWLKKHFGH